MFVANGAAYPHDDIRIMLRGIGQKLAKVVMVRFPEPVFDDHNAAGGNLAGDNVAAKFPGCEFGPHQFEVADVQDVAQPIKVRGQPCAESDLVRPGHVGSHIAYLTKRQAS